MHPSPTEYHENFEMPTRISAGGEEEYQDPEEHSEEYDEGKPVSRIESLWRLRLSFFLFGTINNVLYVIILSAALDLVPPGTPKGIIAFCNIAPALVAKVGWPYILRGKIRYLRRLVSCCLLSVLGMLVVAVFDNLGMRLVGIALASFSSGLGELTFLQLSTTYPTNIAGEAVGYFASGTGGAGILGAAMWWVLRGLGVREGVGISSILPLIIPFTFLCILPPPFVYERLTGAFTSSDTRYEAVPSVDVDTPIALTGALHHNNPISLSLADKWRLVRPLLPKYMLPLFCVYTFEYTINQGIAPTLIYPVPDADLHPLLHSIIKSLRDYYPLWQLVYQIFVFFSRSSLSLGIPPLPAKLLPLPAVLQLVILISLALESAYGLLPESSTGSIPWVALFIAVEGICGGLAYVNVFFRVGQEGREKERTMVDASPHEIEHFAQEREFQIGSIGFADSLGILLASLLAVPTEIMLCRSQVQRGKDLCRRV